VVLVALLAAIAGFVAPAASAEVTPIGNISDTRRVEFKGIVTVHDVIPTDPPPGYRATGSPRWINEGGPWKALVSVHTIQAPTPYAMAIAFAFDGVLRTPTRTHPRTPMHWTPCNTRFRTLRRGQRSTAPCTGRCTAPS
jgi:hypothetical protein